MNLSGVLLTEVNRPIRMTDRKTTRVQHINPFRLSQRAEVESFSRRIQTNEILAKPTGPTRRPTITRALDLGPLCTVLYSESLSFDRLA